TLNRGPIRPTDVKRGRSVFAAKHNTHRPGSARAFGLRARSAVFSWSSRTSARQNPFPWILPRLVRGMDLNDLIRLAGVVPILLPWAVLCCFGLRFACHPVGKLLHEASRGEALDQSQQAVIPLVLSKEQVVRDVIAQRCSLKEALARLQELDREL